MPFHIYLHVWIFIPSPNIWTSLHLQTHRPNGHVPRKAISAEGLSSPQEASSGLSAEKCTGPLNL